MNSTNTLSNKAEFAPQVQNNCFYLYLLSNMKRLPKSLTESTLMSDDLDSVAAHEHATWEGAAATYADNMSPLTAFAGQIPLLVELARISSTDSILELGCGPGDVSNQLAKFADRVVGIDFSDNMIQIAKSRFVDIEFQTADAEQQPFPDNSFDVVVSNYTAHHFARPLQVFEEARRVLKPNGRVVVVMPIQREQVSFASVMTAIFEEISPEEAPGGPLMDAEHPESLMDVLINAGFKNVSASKQEKPLALPTIEPVIAVGWDFMALHDKPQDLQDRIRTRTKQNAKQYQQSDGGYLFPDKVLVASGIA